MYLSLRGCAIECRINAEDPFFGFTPSVGTVPSCNIPYGPGIRVDTYLYPGCSVSGYYDSLVAKLIAWGKDFEESRVRTKNALNEFTVEGINTTIPLFKTIMDEDNFIKGELSTDYLERFSILDRMNRDAVESSKQDLIPAVSAILLRSEFVKKNHLYQQSDKFQTENRLAKQRVNQSWILSLVELRKLQTAN